MARSAAPLLDQEPVVQVGGLDTVRHRRDRRGLSDEGACRALSRARARLRCPGASGTRTLDPWGLRGSYTRDEGEQATYLGELLDVFAAEGVDAAFVYTFARYDLPHDDDPHTDFDVVSAGVVKVLAARNADGGARARRYPDMPWEPKAAFDALAEWYGGAVDG